ncbi:hypothetical protein [Myxococcus phage Mx4 ts27htf-1hrm-1]|nr:hypothetical protein Mx4_p86 [Myxococcus phage Mx4]WNM70423.1 hypothetical protein [Myxococcus phage Mx4 ts27htf-1hrm-1]
MTCDPKLLSKDELTEALKPLSVTDEERVLGHIAALEAQAARVPGLVADALRLAETAEESEKARIQAESERDSAGNDAASATVLQEDAEKECKALRERVATLERERCASMRIARSLANRARAMAGELAKVRDEREEHCDDAMSFERMYQQERTRADTAEARVTELTGQLAAVNEALDDLGYTVTREIGALQSRVQEMAEGCGVALSSHPAPSAGAVGLLERVVQQAVDGNASGDTYNEGWRNGAREVLRRYRAAFDAAKGGEATEDTRTLRHLHTIQRDAKKYRAAVEALNDVDGIARAAAKADGLAPIAAGGGAMQHYGPLGLAGARYVLGLTLATPPAGPGGGEKCRGCNGKGYDEDVDDEGKGHRFACSTCNGTGEAQTTRARIAPTPTPEVPPLKSALDRRQQEDMARSWAKWNAGGMDGQPETDGPVNLLERDGVRVSRHPYAQPGDFMVSYPQDMGSGRALGVLANEVVHLQGLLDINARALSQAVRHAAELGAKEMREQAAGFVVDVSIPIDISFWQGTRKALVAEFARRLSERILTLPLLGKAVARG